MIQFFLLGALDLRDRDGAEVRSVLAQPKRLALLAYLALETPNGFCRRDRLLALFWPEFEAERARLALRQALHFLRRELGQDLLVSRGDEEIGISPEQLWCDATAFERAIEARRFADALELYRGELLPQFFIADASPDFESWLEVQRGRLRSSAARAALGMAAVAESRGDVLEAVTRAREAMRLAPDDEAGVRRLISLLDRAGDRAGALRVYETFTHRLRTDFDVEPASETRALVEAIRSEQVATTPAKRLDDNRVADPHEAGEAQPEAGTRFEQKSNVLRRLPWVAVMFVVLPAMAVVIALWSRTAPRDVPVLAVGWIENAADSTSSETARLLPGLLATDLARVRGLAVVSDARIFEILGQLGTNVENAEAITDAARRAGAEELLQGALYRREGALRLDLRRVNLQSGVVQDVYSVEGGDAFELAHHATAIIAGSFDLDAPVPPAHTGTRSLAARRLYEEGLRELYRAEWRVAHDLFAAALAEDTSFAMAAHYAAWTRSVYDLEGAVVYYERARRLAANAPERDRLLIELGRHSADYASRLAVAETLTTRFPNEPDGHLELAKLLTDAGEFLSAIVHARRVLAMDSLSLSGKHALCRSCDAYAVIVDAYLKSDSLAAAERTIREFIRRQPGSANAWSMLVVVLSLSGRRDAAQRALQEQIKLRPAAEAPYILAQIAIRADDYAEADRLLRAQLRYDPRDSDALWYLIISLRNQGRIREALQLADNGRGRTGDHWSWRLAKAQALFESGDFRSAAVRFDSIVHFFGPTDPLVTPGRRARHESWSHTHTASAWAAVGDTIRLQSIADTIEAVAHLSSYGRDWRLPHHLRGLLWQLRGQPERALQAFRAAVYSPNVGYTRTNLEMARVLLVLNRPAEAVAVLQPALRGPVDASNYYVTRTELHELLASSFEDAQQSDSAAAHYRKVVAAWSEGDPPFRARAEQARQALANLRR